MTKITSKKKKKRLNDDTTCMGMDSLVVYLARMPLFFADHGTKPSFSFVAGEPVGVLLSGVGVEADAREDRRGAEELPPRAPSGSTPPVTVRKVSTEGLKDRPRERETKKKNHANNSCVW